MVKQLLIFLETETLTNSPLESELIFVVGNAEVLQRLINMLLICEYLKISRDLRDSINRFYNRVKGNLKKQLLNVPWTLQCLCFNATS